MQLELGIMRHNLNTPNSTQQIIDYAMEHNVNNFESCYFYLNDQCEEFLYSKLTSYNRNKYKICGKMPVLYFLDHNNFQEIFKIQISRVPQHFFDRYLLQAQNNETSYTLFVQKILPFFLEQKKNGKIKEFGLGIECLPQTFQKYLALNCWDFVQMPLNYYDWYLCGGKENYQLAKQHNLPIIAQSPYKGGLLVKDMPFSSLNNPAAYALNFVKDLDVDLILIGNSSLNTFQKTIFDFNASSIVDTDNNYQNLIQDWANKNKISCIGCNLCRDICNQHLPISSFLRLYDRALENFTSFEDYTILKSYFGEPSHVCNYCGECINICPLSLNIPKIFQQQIFELRV